MKKLLTAINAVSKDTYKDSVEETGATYELPHTGYALLLEELEETFEDLEHFCKCKDALWGHIRHDTTDSVEYVELLKEMSETLGLACGEVIHTRVVVDKMLSTANKGDK